MYIGVIFSSGSSWNYEIWKIKDLTEEEFDDLLDQGDWHQVYEKYVKDKGERVREVAYHPLQDVDAIFWV